MAKVFTLADQLKKLKDAKKAMEAEIKELNQEIQDVEYQLIHHMDEAEMSKFDRSGYVFYSTKRIHAGVKAGCKPNVIDWLKSSEYGDMVKEDVNARTLEAWVKEYVDQNEQLPDEISDYINMFEKQTISIRKA